MQVKLDDHFEFPQTINMRPYTVDAISRTAAAPGGTSSHAPTDAASAGGGGVGAATEMDAAGTGTAAGAPSASASSVSSEPGGSSTSTGTDPSSAADDALALAAGQLYELVGVLVHSGTADSGHYYSYIKERRAAPAATGGAGSWLHFNDTLVEAFDERDIAKACYGGVEPVMQWDVELQKHVQRMAPKPHSAYMLFYEQ